MLPKILAEIRYLNGSTIRLAQSQCESVRPVDGTVATYYIFIIFVFLCLKNITDLNYATKVKLFSWFDWIMICLKFKNYLR